MPPSMSLSTTLQGRLKVPLEVDGHRPSWEVIAADPPVGGRVYSRKFSIGVCREGSRTLTLFKIKEGKTDTLFKDRTRKMTPYSGDPNNG